MANRGATAAVRAEWDKAANQPLHLFELHLDNNVVRATDSYREIEWPAGTGNRYLAVGHLLAFDGIEEHIELRESRVRVVLSGVDQTNFAIELGQNYLDRRLVIYQAFLNSAGGVVVDPFALFDGRVDQMGGVEDPSPGAVPGPGLGNCSVTVEATAHWSDFGRRPGRHTNHEEQQLYFSGDKGFEFVSEIAREITWGGATIGQSSGTVAGPAGGGGDPN